MPSSSTNAESAAHKSRYSKGSHCRTVSTSPRLICYEHMLPTEIWRIIVNLIPTLDLFSLYNTSTYMRALSAPLLVQAMASKTIQLYFYQEYVRRIGIKFEFDHFDLKRDRIVYRPQVLDFQHRFKCGMTLQNPHLEEIAVFSSANPELSHNQVRCIDGRYYTIQADRSGKRTLTKASSKSSSVPIRLTELESVTESELSTATTAMAGGAERTSQKRTTSDERGYHGTKNFLDKACPIHIRKDGAQELDGSRYCFLQGYPWSLQYQVAYESFGVPLKKGDKSKDHESSGSSNGGAKKRDQFFFDLRADLRAEAQARAEVRALAQQQHTETHGDNGTEDANGSGTGSSSSSNNNNNSNSRENNNTDGENVFPSGDESPLQSGLSDSHNFNSTTYNNPVSNGGRYFRVLRFECSMNFLDLKRATRNIIGRWLEGKVQHWKKVLGVKKHTIQYHQQDLISDTAEPSSQIHTVPVVGKRKQNRKVIQVIDSILGPPAKPISNRHSTMIGQHSFSLGDRGNADDFYGNAIYSNNHHNHSSIANHSRVNSDCSNGSSRNNGNSSLNSGGNYSDQPSFRGSELSQSTAQAH